MDQDRFNNLAILSIEKDVSVDHKIILGALA